MADDSASNPQPGPGLGAPGAAQLPFTGHEPSGETRALARRCAATIGAVCFLALMTPLNLKVLGTGLLPFASKPVVAPIVTAAVVAPEVTKTAAEQLADRRQQAYDALLADVPAASRPRMLTAMQKLLAEGPPAPLETPVEAGKPAATAVAAPRRSSKAAAAAGGAPTHKAHPSAASTTAKAASGTRTKAAHAAAVAAPPRPAAEPARPVEAAPRPAGS